MGETVSDILSAMLAQWEESEEVLLAEMSKEDYERLEEAMKVIDSLWTKYVERKK